MGGSVISARPVYPPSRDVPSWVGAQMRLREFSDAGAYKPPYTIEELKAGKAFSLKREARVNGVTVEQWQRHEAYMRKRKRIFPDEIAAGGLDYVDSVEDLEKLMGPEWPGFGY